MENKCYHKIKLTKTYNNNNNNKTIQINFHKISQQE